MRRFCFIAVLLLLILSLPMDALAVGENSSTDEKEEWDHTLQDIMTQLDLGEMNAALMQAEEAGRTLLGTSVQDAVIRAAEGKLKLDAWEIVQMIFASSLNAIRSHSGILVKILVLTIISAILEAIKPSFASQKVAGAAEVVCYLLIITLLAQMLVSVVDTARGAIDSMTGVISAVFPILLLLLTAMGGGVSGAVFSPAMAVLTGSIGVFIKSTTLPMVLVCGVMVLASNLSGRARLGKMAVFIKKIAAWSIGVVFVVFLGVTALQGLTGAAIDGISMRTAKYAIDKFVPIIGGMFSDTVDTLIGCTLVVKNGVGIVGMILVAINVLRPVLSITAASILLSFSAAMIEPFAEKRICQCVSDLSGVMTLLAVSILALGAMMFILISLAIGAGNINIMMR